jgi:ribonuclease J
VLALGRSLQTHLAIAELTGLPTDDVPPMVHPDNAQSIPRSQLLVLVTGSQGEPLAALPRLARGEHHALKLDAGDEVILSSRIIPGREVPVHTMIDRLERRGVRVWNWHDDRGLHTSGHACRDEQQRLIELIRPHAFLPVHGGYAMLKRHAELAREVGVPHGIVAENGTVVQLDDTGLHAVDTIRSGRVHRHMMVEIDDATLRERREMARRGLVMVGLTTGNDRAPRGQPNVRTRGLPVDDVLLKNARAEAARAIRTVERRGGTLPEAIARTLTGLFARELGWRPVVEVLISQVDG